MNKAEKYRAARDAVLVDAVRMIEMVEDWGGDEDTGISAGAFEQKYGAHPSLAATLRAHFGVSYSAGAALLDDYATLAREYAAVLEEKELAEREAEWLRAEVTAVRRDSAAAIDDTLVLLQQSPSYQLAAERDAARAEAERAKESKEHVQAEFALALRKAEEHAADARREMQRWFQEKRRNDTLEAALAPFAVFSAAIMSANNQPDDRVFYRINDTVLTFGDLRRAALTARAGEGE